MIGTMLMLASSVALSPAAQPAQKAWSILEEGVRSKNVDMRTNAVHALRLLRDNQAAREMAERALGDDRWAVRAAAAEALGRMGAVSSVSRLRAALGDEEPEVVLAAANSLSLLGDLTAYEVYSALLTGERKSGPSSMESQMKVLKDRNAIAKLCFEEAIGFIPFANLGYKVFKRVGFMKRMTSNDGTSSMRAAAALRLGGDPDPRGGTALVNSTADRNWLVRVAVVDAIAGRDDPALLSAVIPLVDDDNDSVKYDAAAAVVRLSVPELPSNPMMHAP